MQKAKQNDYRVNPIKRDVMRQETQYLVEHGIVTPSFPGVHHVCWSLNPMVPHVFHQIIERLTKSPNQIHTHYPVWKIALNELENLSLLPS